MCKHTYKVIEIENNKERAKVCEWVVHFNNLKKTDYYKDLKYKTLPHDKDDYCLFHSTDLDWKRKNKFTDRFYEFCNFWDKIATEEESDGLNFHECHFVGHKSEFMYDFESEPTYSIEFENFLFKNHILFFDSIFHDSLRIDRALFKKGITIDNCRFLQDIDILNVFIGDDITLSPNNVFEGNVSLTNLRLLGKFDCIKNTFNGRFEFDTIDCRSEVYIDTSSFENTQEYVNFTAFFHNGFSLRSNIFNSLLTISESVFTKDSLLYDNKFNSEFHFENSTINGNIAFVGTENNLLFTPHSIIDLSAESFQKNGMLIFDYCNILNLGNAFITKLKELENYQLVIIRDTCKIDRLVIIREYNYSFINDYIITDFSNLITRFFKHYFSINLNVEIVRNIKNNKIKLIYKTTDKIDDNDFKERLLGINDKFDIFSKTKPSSFENDKERDFAFTWQSLIHRIVDKFNSNLLTQDEIIAILTLQKTVPLNNTFNILMNNVEIRNNILAENIVFNSENQNFNNSIFNENK